MSDRSILDLVAPAPGELIVILAPMTAGKTVLIQNLLNDGRLRPEQIVATTQDSAALVGIAERGVAYHFNSLIALADAARSVPSVQRTFGDLLAAHDFRSVSYWSDVLRWPGPKRAVVLVIDELSWWRRIAARVDTVAGSGAADYPSDFWLQLAQLTDLAAHYRQVAQGLRDDGFAMVALDATKPDYVVIEDFEAHLCAMPLKADVLSDDDISQFTRHSGFERGLTQERRWKNALKRRRHADSIKALFEEAKVAIWPEVAGKTVLDIQCGWGGMCFEAERRGAARVVGYETEPDRMAAAYAMKRILKSNAEFHFTDARSTHSDGPFDFVIKTDGRFQFLAA